VPSALPFGAMRTHPRRIRAAAVLAALAVLVAGCADLAPPTPAASPGATQVALAVSPSPAPSPVWAPSPSASDAPAADDWLAPGDPPTPPPTPTPTPPPFHGRAVATRIVIPRLGIDLAIVKSPPAGVYPYCNVAMYFGKPLGQPGESRATYIFAHARDGMFGPIYVLTMVRRTPDKMIGMLVHVYTSDSKEHTYRITKVYPHQLTLNRALAARSDQLWLQTSEGPHGTPGKTQVLARPVSVTVADYATAHPKAHIVHCG
jgi:hypothetical protein